jgi:Restriction endonuclease
VGRPVVQGFVGALQGARASKGIIFTASDFSAEARTYAATVSPRVILIDGERLAALMIDYNVGVSERETYPVKRATTSARTHSLEPWGKPSAGTDQALFFAAIVPAGVGLPEGEGAPIP